MFLELDFVEPLFERLLVFAFADGHRDVVLEGDEVLLYEVCPWLRLIGEVCFCLLERTAAKLRVGDAGAFVHEYLPFRFRERGILGRGALFLAGLFRERLCGALRCRECLGRNCRRCGE